MHFLQIISVLVIVVACKAQQPHTTPVPILKQINRHNEDGSYSYGYEAADGSYKIESKYPDGQVFGKYGYVDEGGKVREVEYGASNRGFEPAGSHINVPPPTLHATNNNVNPLAPGQEDDGQYREDPSIYYKNEEYNRPKTPSSSKPHFFQQQLTQPGYKPQPQYNSLPQHQFSFNSQPQQYYNPQPVQQQQQQYYNPAPQAYNRPAPVAIDPNIFRGHPASNFDVNTGSYSISY